MIYYSALTGQQGHANAKPKTDKENEMKKHMNINNGVIATTIDEAWIGRGIVILKAEINTETDTLRYRLYVRKNGADSISDFTTFRSAEKAYFKAVEEAKAIAE